MHNINTTGAMNIRQCFKGKTLNNKIMNHLNKETNTIVSNKHNGYIKAINFPAINNVTITQTSINNNNSFAGGQSNLSLFKK